jgi:hypothetical protein
VALTGLLAIVALILTAFGLMFGIVKPADAIRRVAAILGVVIALMSAPGVLVGVWSAMSLWQRLGLAAIGVGVWQWRRPCRRQRKSD